MLHGGEDVLGTVEVVLVESMMFKSRADKPGALCGFDEETAARGDVLLVVAIQVVVRSPSPHVLDVGGGTAGEVEESPGGFAIGWRAGAFRLDLASYCAANSEVGVPESDVAGFVAGHVYFDLFCQLTNETCRQGD